MSSNTGDLSDKRAGGARPATSAKVFISYKRSVSSDEKLAQALFEHFSGSGHDVFIDVGMKVGTDWVGEITKRIGWCDFLIVLLSNSAVESEMVQAEVRLAHQRRRQDGRPAILPVRVSYKGALGYELDAYLGRIQYIHWANDGETARVIRELAGSIEGHEKPLHPAPSLDELDLAAPEKVSESGRRPCASEDPRVLLPPGGTIKLDDKFYVARSPDDQINKMAKLRGRLWSSRLRGRWESRAF